MIKLSAKRSTESKYVSCPENNPSPQGKAAMISLGTLRVPSLNNRKVSRHQKENSGRFPGRFGHEGCGASVTDYDSM